MHGNTALSKFPYNKYVHDERRICAKLNVFHPPPLETKDCSTISCHMPTMLEKALTEENESLKTFLELSEISTDHYKSDRDCLRVELKKFKDGNEKTNFEVSYPALGRAKIHGLSLNEFEDLSGNSKLNFGQNKLGKESLNLRNSLLEKLTQQQKTIATQNQEVHKLRNETKKRDTRIKELENSVRGLQTENKSLQGIREDSKKRELELTKVKDHRLDKELEQLHFKANSQETVLKQKNIKIFEKEEEVKKRDIQITNLTNQLQQAKGKLNETESGMRDTKISHIKQVQELEKEIKQLHFTANRQKSESKMKDSERFKIEEDVKKRNLQITSLTDQLQQAKRKLMETESELRDTKTSLSKQVHEMEKEIEQLHFTADRQKAYTKMGHSERFEIQEDVKKRDLQITSLTDQLQQAERKLMKTISELQDTKTAHSKQVQSLEKEIEQLHFTANRQKAESKIRDSERFEIEGDVKKRDLQITSLTDQLQQAKRKLMETISELRDTKTAHSKQVQSLEKEIEQLHFTANRPEEDSKTSKMENREKLELEKDLRKREQQITVLNDNLQQMKGKLKETESELREMKTRRTDHSLQKQVHRLEKEIGELRRKTNHQEAVSETSKRAESERVTMEEELKRRQVEITCLTDQLQQVKRKLTEKEFELQETKTRLSKAMGDRLTDNNPNIADLSDKNRPVKLAERFGELYDNQWTDAYDVIEKYFKTEEKTLGVLLNILQEIFCFCKTNCVKQMEDLHKALWFSANSDDVPTEVSKILKDCKKTTASVAMRNLYEIYISRLQHSGDEQSRIALEIRPFVQECLEICWLMMIQDPPVVFAPTAERGSKLNTDIFKPYTKSGTHVEFTVWPAMLLHKGGPVLTKGVAQGYKKE